MKLGNPKNPSRSETPGVPADASWIDDYMAPRDSHVKHLTQCLQGLWSLPDNANVEIKELEVKNGVDATLTLQRLRGIPIGVQVIWSALYDYHHLKVALLDEKRVKFAVKWDSAPTKAVKVRLLFWGA
jgi:hypothetical protein